MKPIIKFSIFIIIIALLALGAIRLVKLRKSQEAKIPPAKEYAVSVKTLQAKKGNVKLTLPYIALVQNDNDTVIASKISARILDIKKAGSKVKKGDIIVNLDDSSLRAKLTAIKHSIVGAMQELNATQTSFQNLQRIHKRTKELLDVHGASQEQYQNEEVKLSATQAKLSEIQAQIVKLKSDKTTIEDSLSYSTIKAPIDGIVSKSIASVGDLAMPGKPLLKLSAIKGTYLLVRLPGNAKSIDFNGKQYPLTSLHSTFNGLNEFRADIDQYIPTGNREEVSVVVYEGKGVLLPEDTILDRNGKSYLFIFDKNDKIKILPVRILASGQEGIVVNGSFNNKNIIEAKPDILLRLLSGYPVIREPISQERREK